MQALYRFTHFEKSNHLATLHANTPLQGLNHQLMYYANIG